MAKSCSVHCIVSGCCEGWQKACSCLLLSCMGMSGPYFWSAIAWAIACSSLWQFSQMALLQYWKETISVWKISGNPTCQFLCWSHLEAWKNSLIALASGVFSFPLKHWTCPSLGVPLSVPRVWLEGLSYVLRVKLFTSFGFKNKFILPHQIGKGRFFLPSCLAWGIILSICQSNKFPAIAVRNKSEALTN